MGFVKDALFAPRDKCKVCGSVCLYSYNFCPNCGSPFIKENLGNPILRDNSEYLEDMAALDEYHAKDAFQINEPESAQPIIEPDPAEVRKAVVEMQKNQAEEI